MSALKRQAEEATWAAAQAQARVEHLERELAALRAASVAPSHDPAAEADALRAEYERLRAEAGNDERKLMAVRFAALRMVRR